jgi:hypothetical protein
MAMRLAMVQRNRAEVWADTWSDYLPVVADLEHSLWRRRGFAVIDAGRLCFVDCETGSWRVRERFNRRRLLATGTGPMGLLLNLLGTLTQPVRIVEAVCSFSSLVSRKYLSPASCHSPRVARAGHSQVSQGEELERTCTPLLCLPPYQKMGEELDEASLGITHLQTLLR